MNPKKYLLPSDLTPDQITDICTFYKLGNSLTTISRKLFSGVSSREQLIKSVLTREGVPLRASRRFRKKVAND